MRWMFWLAAAVVACGQSPAPPVEVTTPSSSATTAVPEPSAAAIPDAASVALDRPPADDPVRAAATATATATPTPTAMSKPMPKPGPSRAQRRCVEGLKRALSRAAKLADLAEGELEDRTSGDLVELAYFDVDADVRLPRFAVRIEPSSSASGHGAWRTTPGLPSWSAALKPPSSPQAMPVRWPSDHLERHRDGLVATIVTMSATRAGGTVIEASADACIQGWRR